MASDQNRQSKLSIDLGGEQIDLIQLKSSEAFSQPFHVSIDMLSSLAEIDLMPHLGKQATISISEDDVLQRYVSGIVTDGEFLEEIEGTGFVYRLTLRPKSYLHEQGRRFRIFQMQSTREIIKAVLDDCGIQHNFDKLKGGKRIRKYCVQYGESDFSFVSRLMEEEGIYYFYAHSERDHVLTICDSPCDHDLSKASPLTFNPMTSTVANVDSAVRFDSGHRAFIQEWRERVETGGEAKVTLCDFDFQRPGMPLQQLATGERQHPEDMIEVFNYPGRYYVDDEGKELAESLLAARRANRRTFSGSSKNAGLSCGTSFKLKHPDNKRYNGKYVLTRCQHSIRAETYRSSMGGGGHSVDFEAVPADTLWKSLPTTPRPVVRGPETAIVTGPPGEEIHCDKYGRVKIKFHWDCDGEKYDHSSCWIRVSQTGGLGNLILPRVGHEVIVDFINGDPDRPVIVGRVFNEEHMPIYPLPENKTRALWRTATYGETGDYGTAKAVGQPRQSSNEMRFEDKGGEEEIMVNAQRDMNIFVHHSEVHDVGNCQAITVGHNRSITVGHDDGLTVGNDRIVTIGHNRDTTISNNDALTVGTNQSVTVGSSIRIVAGDTIDIEAGSRITLKVGGSEIVMDGSSIEITAMNLKTNASLQAEHRGASAEVRLGPVGASVKGTMVLINSS
jgi:type VI secretion system secreted protein VgrG